MADDTYCTGETSFRRNRENRPPVYGNRGADDDAQDDSRAYRGVRVNRRLKVNQHINVYEKASR